MNRFGELLRFYRHQSYDVEHNKRLTQERLGELMGHELDGAGYSGAAVSDWELGKSQINKDDRRVLMSLIKVLNQSEGLKTLNDANALLAVGNYRRLDETKKRLAFPGAKTHPPASETFKEFWQMIGLYFDDQIQALIDELRTYLAQSVNGSQIHWSQTILALIAWPVHRMSDGRFVRTFISILIWLLTCLTTYPLVRFTFKNPIQIQQAVLLYTIGLLIPPLIIAARTRTVSDEFWQCNGPDNPAVLRLYTHQGAFVGYTIGQFTVFFPALFAYYVGIGPPSPLVWGLASLWPILLSMASARQVPFNL